VVDNPGARLDLTIGTVALTSPNHLIARYYIAAGNPNNVLYLHEWSGVIKNRKVIPTTTPFSLTVGAIYVKSSDVESRHIVFDTLFATVSIASSGTSAGEGAAPRSKAVVDIMGRNSKITLRFRESINRYTIAVVDYAGRTVLGRSYTYCRAGASSEIDITNLARGVYVTKIEWENGHATAKVAVCK
jgi:hypothetical protein